MAMPSSHRRQSNSNNLVFLTPITPMDGRRQNQQYRSRFNSAPSWRNEEQASPQFMNRRNSYVQSPNKGNNQNRKRRSGSGMIQQKDFVIIDDEPDNKKKRNYNLEIEKHNMSGMDRLSEQMLQLSSQCQQTDDLLQKKLRLRSTLLAIFRREFPDASLHLVGSSCNGFASQSSDADFCLMITPWRMVDQRFEAVVYLRRLQKLLKHCPYIKDLQVIRAKVPILKFRDSVSSCQCDVNINNSVGIRNTHLLRTYSRVDSRVRPLVVIVKKWASSRRINDASQGTLSSYSLVLMVIHFLQAGTKVPVVPSLQQQYPDFFRHDLSLDHLPMFDPAEMIPCNRSANKQSVAELLEGFLDYFSNHFRWDFLAVSVRLGRATPKALNPEAREKPIFIEEPFDHTNTARSVYDWNAFCRIKAEFKRVLALYTAASVEEGVLFQSMLPLNAIEFVPQDAVDALGRAHELMKEKPSLEELFGTEAGTTR